MLAEFLHRCSGGQQEDFLRLRQHPLFFGECARGSFLERRPCQNFFAQFHGRGYQRNDARHGALHQHLDDQHAVDFVRAFENAVDAAIAIGARDRIILMEAVAAENLHRFVHAEVQRFAAHHFADRTFDRIFLEHLHGL